MSFYDVMVKAFTPIIRTLLRVKVTGEENVPPEGKLVVCSNHTSMFDPMVIAVTLNRPVSFMAKKELFKIPVVGGFLRAMGVFPVNRSVADVSAIKITASHIEKGEAVGIFPQGTRCPRVDPSQTKIKNGVGMISFRTKCDVLPVYLKAPKNKLRIFRRTEVVIGKPLKNSELGFENGGAAEYEKASKLIFSRICALGGYLCPIGNENPKGE